MKNFTRFLTTAALLCIALVLKAEVPFKATTIMDGGFAKTTTWYTMQIGANGYLISDNGDAESIALDRVKTELADADLWCFVGNDADGYRIYNKQSGAAKVLASPAITGDGGSTFPTMQAADALPAGFSDRWDFAPSDKLGGVEGCFMKLHGTNTAVNNYGGFGALAFWTGGMDGNSTVVFEFAETSVEILNSTGSFTSSNAGKTWHSVWSSSRLEGFTLGTGANNMKAVGDNISAYSGTSGGCTHRLTAPDGCVVAGYSFDFKNEGGDGSYSLTMEINGKTYKSSKNNQHIDVQGLEERIASYAQSGANKGILFSNYFVKVCRSLVPAEPQSDIFITRSGGVPYRIPAIAKAYNGDIIAVADYRHSGADIGMVNNGRIDLRASISKDGGRTWGDIFAIVEGKGASSPDFMHVGFGDPCIVADRESPRVLVLSCAGNVSFPGGTRNNHQNMARFYSEDNGATWSAPVDISESIYSQFDNSIIGPVMAMFVGSGKIVQSYTTKVGEYYRLYCAVLCKDKDANYTNFVLYSDDFGGSWGVLGGVDVPPVASGGDEPKVEELPDGSILLSSRINGGRFFNIFSFTDSEKAEGSWGSVATSSSGNDGVVAAGNSTNGEVMCLPVTRRADGKDMYLLLQSVPFGSGRSNVGIYYKELGSLADFINPDSIAKDWDGRHQASYLGSAYSTMCLQADNTLGFLYEEETYGAGYTIVYKNYSIEYITDSAYTYNAAVDRDAFVAEAIDLKAADTGAAGTYVGCYKESAADSIQAAITAYKAAPSKGAYEAVNNALATAPKWQIEEGAWYRLRNADRQNATLYLTPGASKYTAAVKDNADADQFFTFVPASGGNYYLSSGNFSNYLGKLGDIETEPKVTTSADAAGVWSVMSAVSGLSQVICRNATGSKKGLHLAGDCSRLVPWNESGSPASLWYVEPVDSYSVNVPESGYTTLNLPFTVKIVDGVQAYAVIDEVVVDGVACLRIEEVEDYIAGPVIIKAAQGTYTLPIDASYTPVDGEPAAASLSGTLCRKSVSGNIYQLGGSEFKRRSSTSGYVNANTAYYASGNTADTLPLTEQTGNSLVGIEDMDADAENIILYDLNGRRVERPERGIYVTSDGSKVFVK